jgi:hypothetical protein
LRSRVDGGPKTRRLPFLEEIRGHEVPNYVAQLIVAGFAGLRNRG